MPRKHTFLSAAQIRKEFESASAVIESSAPEVRNLSVALGALRDAGIDVEYEVSGWPGVDSALGVSNSIISLTGILRVGHNQHVLTLVTRDTDQHECWALSYHNVRIGGVKEEEPDVFDTTERECYADLQKRIIELAIENKFIADNDVARAFSHGPNSETRFQLAKPLIKPARAGK